MKKRMFTARSMPMLLCALLLAGSSVHAASRPNIVFIVADDLDWADLSCYGSAFHQTPKLDRMAKQGMRFADAYSASNVCLPTHLHLTDWVTGRPDRQDQKLKRPDFQKFLPLKEVTLAEAVKEAATGRSANALVQLRL